jgi:hypothetical protein
MEIVLLILPLALATVLWVLPVLSAYRGETALRELAAYMGLNYQPATHKLFAQQTLPTVSGTHRGRRFLLHAESRIWGVRRLSEYRVRHVDVEVVNESNAHLVLLSAAQERVLLKALFARRRIRTGDEQFDQRFFIEGSTPEGFAQRLLTSSFVRQQLLDVFRGMQRRRIELKGQQLTLEETLPWYHLQSVANEVAYLRRLVDAMIDLAKGIDAIT